jgi:hypothetical protein
VAVVLGPRDPAALASFVAGVSTPGSPTYGDYLAPGQFGPRFGAAPQTIAAVSGALRAAGLDPGPPAADDLAVPVTATAPALAAALRIGFASYSLPGGRVAFANTARPELPAAVAADVLDVIGLQTLTRPRALGVAAATGSLPAGRSQASPGALAPVACGAAATAAASQQGYTIDQIAEGYDLDPFYSAADEGSGTTVGVYELEPDLPSDIAAYESCFGVTTTVDYLPVDGGAGTGAGTGEAAIDIENVIGIAPQSRIEVFQGPTTGSGPLDTYIAMADADISQVNTTSWGLCEPDMLAGDANAIADETPVFEQMVAQGQTLYAAAGDDGAEDCLEDPGSRDQASLAVDDPGSQTQVTSVGGTSLVDSYTAGAPRVNDPTPLGVPPGTPPPFQTVWNEATVGAGAGGGGVSAVHAMPSYQSAAPAALNVLNADSSGAACGAPAGLYCREVPDVSGPADPASGTVIYCTDDGTPGTLCQGGTATGSPWESTGGTSAAAPFWAGLTALINSDAGAGCGVPATFGEINSLLYAIAGGSGYAAALTDIKSPPAGFPSDNDYTGGHAGLYPVGTGYDMATGLGTPLAGGPDGLADQLCALRAPVTQAPVVSSLSPTGGPAAAGTAVTIDGAFFVPGASVSVGGTPASAVQVVSFNQIVAVLPAGSGAEPVTVTTAHGVSNAQTYTYPTPPPPAPAPVVPAQPAPAAPSNPSPAGSPPASGAAPPATASAGRSGPGAAQLLLACTGAKLAITDVVDEAGHVEITGATEASLAGRRVRILFGAKRTPLAGATVASSGLFSVAEPLPRASLRAGARYQAVIGSLASAGASLSRRLVLDPPRAADRAVTLTGSVVGPLASPPAPVLVSESTSCAARRTVASVRPSAAGRFTVRLTEPAGVRAVLYRLETRVRGSRRSRSTVSASSLLEPVALG